MKVFTGQGMSVDSFHAQLLKSEKVIGEIRMELGQLKGVIGMGKDKIMREYLGRN